MLSLEHLPLTFHSNILHLSEKVSVAQDAHKPVICEIHRTPHTQLLDFYQSALYYIFTLFALIALKCTAFSWAVLLIIRPTETEERESESNKQEERRDFRRINVESSFSFSADRLRVHAESAAQFTLFTLLYTFSLKMSLVSFLCQTYSQSVKVMVENWQL